mgnify:CR=1 FL=1
MASPILITTASEIDALAEREWRDYLANLALEKAKSRFNERTIQAFLALANERKPAEVAQELGIAENTVYVHHNRVRSFIRKTITELKTDLD